MLIDLTSLHSQTGRECEWVCERERGVNEWKETTNMVFLSQLALGWHGSVLRRKRQIGYAKHRGSMVHRSSFSLLSSFCVFLGQLYEVMKTRDPSPVAVCANVPCCVCVLMTQHWYNILRTALKSRKCIVIEHQSFPGIRIGLEYDTYCESTSCMTQDTLQKYKLKSKYKVLCEVSKSFIGIIKVSNSQNIGIT